MVLEVDAERKMIIDIALGIILAVIILVVVRILFSILVEHKREIGDFFSVILAICLVVLCLYFVWLWIGSFGTNPIQAMLVASVVLVILWIELFVRSDKRYPSRKLRKGIRILEKFLAEAPDSIDSKDWDRVQSQLLWRVKEFVDHQVLLEIGRILLTVYTLDHDGGAFNRTRNNIYQDIVANRRSLGNGFWIYANALSLVTLIWIMGFAFLVLD